MEVTTKNKSINLWRLPEHIFIQVCRYLPTSDLVSLSKCSQFYLSTVRKFSLPVTFKIVFNYNYSKHIAMYLETLNNKTNWWISEINLLCDFIKEKELKLMLSSLEQFTSFLKHRLNLIRVYVRESEAFLTFSKAVFFSSILKVISNENTDVEVNTNIVLSRRLHSSNINFVDYFPDLERVKSVICNNCVVRKNNLEDLPVFKELKSLKIRLSMKLDTEFGEFFIEDASKVFDEPKFPNLRILYAKIDSTFFDYLNYHAPKLTHLNLEPRCNLETPYCNIVAPQALHGNLKVPKNCQILRCTGEILSLCTLTDNVKDIHVVVTNNSSEIVKKFLSKLNTSSVEVLVVEFKNEMAFDSQIVSSISGSLQLIHSLKSVSFEGNNNFAGPESVALLSDELTELSNVIKFLWFFGVSLEDDPTAPYWQWRQNKLSRWHFDDVIRA